MIATYLFRCRGVLGMLIAGILVVGLAGCSGDDDNPTNTGGGNTTSDDFDQSEAISQAQTAAPQAVNLVQSMIAMAAGFNKDGEKDYAWNEQTQSWEYHYTYSGEGNVYDWFYTVQYLGPSGEPQESPQGAQTISHAMSGTGEYHYEYEGTVLDYDYFYEYATTIAGLGTGTLVMTGGGSQDIDYTYNSPEGNYAFNYAVGWEILSPGIIINGEGACPIGTIRYDFMPYYWLIVFDGSNTASSTLYDSGDNPVSGSEGTHSLSCDAP